MKAQLYNSIVFWSERFSERSTWLGLIAILSAAGLAIDQELLVRIMTLGMAVAGFILMITKDKKDDTSRGSSIREESGSPLQGTEGASNGPGLQMEPTASPRNCWRQKLS